MLGPTGSGKSQLALRLAETFRGQVVGCDSIQVYRGLDVGSAKLTPAERRGVAHHLIDIIDPDGELTAGEYARLARPTIRKIQANGFLPIVTGGTGFYLRALLDGLSPAPTRDDKLRARLSTIAVRRPSALHSLLSRRDPQAAKRIHPNDHQKIIRALELSMMTGQPASDMQKLPRDAFHEARVLKLGLAPDRSLLRNHLDARVKRMFQNGLLEEAEALLKAHFSPELKPLQSLGYKQAVDIVRGRMSLDEAVRECQARTRQYAKRQMTWFRGESSVEWLTGFGTDDNVQENAIAAGRNFLAAAENG
ncbi:MAG: tRNA (adenosine(37)-N6)-dimethylallyltransferase MiaA [Acidobacteriota bacterium]|nr:tRNA (adenosine(37)-N6)-dimethylallyltransferase MiaA [Acidobacteriota bacterium]